MPLVTPEIDAYCAAHSTTPSVLCGELEGFTRQSVPMSQMLCGPVVGGFLGFFVGALGARRVLEIGTYTGYSALAMAERLSDGGEVVTLDINPETNAVARRFWDQSPHGRKIRAILGPALDTLSRLEGEFDLVFIDADKENYLAYLRAVLPRLGRRGVVVADNCLWSGSVVGDAPADAATMALRRFNDAVHADSTLESVLLPVRDGLHVIRRRGHV